MTEKEFNKKYHVRLADCCLSCRFYTPDSYEMEGTCNHKDHGGEGKTTDYMVCDEFEEV